MQIPPGSRNRDTIEAGIGIQRPPSEVFAFYRDFRNLPRFLGDVMAVVPVGPTLFRWTIQGPLGLRVHWMTRLTEVRPDELIRYETVSLPGLRTCWEIRISSGAEPQSSEVHEVMTLPLGRLGRAALALTGKPPREEITANLRRLKQILETGKVTDTSYAVAGKLSVR